MIKSRKDLRFYIEEDRKSNKVNNCYYLFFLLCGAENAQVYRYLKSLRHCEYHLNNEGFYHKIMYVVWRIYRGRIGSKYRIKIALNTAGYGLRIPHISGGGVYLTAQRIGNYCSFNAGSFIGNNGKGKNPILGDHVSLGPGARAFGAIKIGSYSFIAPGAVVVKDVDEYSIVGGVPAKFIKKNRNDL